MQKLLKRSEVQTILGVSRGTLYKLIRQGRIPPPLNLTTNGVKRWPADVIEKCVASWSQKENSQGD
jgi:predicted DNA-binding transcriptional regulator AlpA